MIELPQADPADSSKDRALASTNSAAVHQLPPLHVPGRNSSAISFSLSLSLVRLLSRLGLMTRMEDGVEDLLYSATVGGSTNVAVEVTVINI